MSIKFCYTIKTIMKIKNKKYNNSDKEAILEMYKKNLKRNFLLASISVLSIGILSGCSNQVNYMGSNFEEFISEQVKTSSIMSSQLSDALNGNFYSFMLWLITIN